jgi:hypothetical protein
MTGHQPDLVAAGAEWSAAAEMDAFETVMWRAEADPRFRSTLTLVEVLDQVPDASRLLSRSARQAGYGMTAPPAVTPWRV